MQIRVHELARELGVSAREVLAKCSECGEFIKSASSTIPPRLVRKLREDFGTANRSVSPSKYGNAMQPRRSSDADDGGFGTALQRARHASRPNKSKSTQPSGGIEIAIYRYAIDPRRSRQGRYTPEERDRAERLTKRWAGTWLSDIPSWIAVSGGEHADLAVRFSQAGLTAEDVGLRLGFGRIDPSRDAILARVAKGTLGFNDAVRQVKEFRQSQSESASG